MTERATLGFGEFRPHYFASFCEKKWFPFIYIFTCARAIRYAVYNLKYSRETSYYLVKIGMQSICSSYLSTTSVSSRLWAKNAGSAACPLGPAHGLYSECAALSSASLLSLSYHLLRSLILACAGTDARLCAGGELLALLLALHFHRRMELSVLHFLPTINDLPPHI
jgi:hypothetical protein